MKNFNVFGEIKFDSEAEACEFSEHIDYYCISKKCYEDENVPMTYLPPVFFKDHDGYSEFVFCKTLGNMAQFKILASDKLFGDGTFQSFAEFISKMKGLSGLVAYHHKDYDFEPDFHHFISATFQPIYGYGDNQEIDEVIFEGEQEDLNLEIVFDRLRENNISLSKKYESKELEVYEKFISTLAFLKAPKIFDETPYPELGEQNFLANMHRDSLRDSLIDLDDDVKRTLQIYIESVFSCGLNATLNTIKSSNAKVIINDVDIAKDTSLFVDR